jgi:hypothetical protein
MDVAKAIVTIFVTKILVTGLSMTAVDTVVFPVSVGIFIIVTVGFIVTFGIHSVDKHYGLSEKLITSVRKGLKAYQEISEWNFEHDHSGYSFMIRGIYR